MLPRFTTSDFAAVGYYLGIALCYLSAFMLMPALVALIFSETEALSHFLLGAAICFASGMLLLQLKRRKLNRRRSLVFAGGGWFVCAFFAAIPLYGIGAFDSYFDAMFDAMSAITTTGMTISTDVDHMAFSQITWRSMLSLFGAQAVVIIALYLGFFGEGRYARRVEAHTRDRWQGVSMRKTSNIVVVFILGLVLFGTAVIFIILLIQGMNPRDALLNGFWLACSAGSTGSFVPHASNIIFFHNMWLNGFLAFMMLVVTIHFAVYLIVFRGKFTASGGRRESKGFAIWLAALVVIVTIVLAKSEIVPCIAGAISQGTFMVISCATTCGMQTVYPDQFSVSYSEGVVALLVLAVLVGAAACTPSGGLKTVRAGHVFLWMIYTVKNALVPNKMQAALPSISSETKRSAFSSNAMQAMVISILYFAFIAIGAIAFIMHGYPVFNSLLESTAFTSNAGITSGITLSSTQLDLKIIAFIQMWAGRVEFIAFFCFVFGLLLNVLPGRGHKRRRRKNKHSKKRLRVFAGAATLLVLVSCTSVLLINAPQAYCEPESTATTQSASSSSAATPSTSASPTSLSAETSTSSKEGDDAIYRKVDVQELLSSTKRLDGMNVEISGEAIGSALNADDNHVWVNILQNGRMIGVYMEKEAAQCIKNWGKYHVTGDTIKVQGVFDLSCADHAGELEVHAKQVQVEKEGVFHNEGEVSVNYIAFAVLMLIGLGLVGVYYVRKGSLPRLQLKY